MSAYLQFPLIKYLNPFQRNHLIETIHEGLGLLFDTSSESPLRHPSTKTENAGRQAGMHASYTISYREKETKRDSLKVVKFVFFSNQHVLPSLDELVVLDHTQNLKVHRKVHLKPTLFNVIVPGKERKRGPTTLNKAIRFTTTENCMLFAKQSIT